MKSQRRQEQKPSRQKESDEGGGDVYELGRRDTVGGERAGWWKLLRLAQEEKGQARASRDRTDGQRRAESGLLGQIQRLTDRLSKERELFLGVVVCGRGGEKRESSCPPSLLVLRASPHVIIVATLLRRRPSSISLLFSPPSHPSISTTLTKSIRFIVATSSTLYLTDPTVIFN